MTAREHTPTDDAFLANRANEFRQAVRGLPTRRIWYAMNRVTQGVDWRGCSKEHLARSYAEQRHGPFSLGDLRQALAALPADRKRQPPATPLGDIIGKLRANNAALVAALREIAEHDVSENNNGREQFKLTRFQTAQIARAALAAVDRSEA